MQPASDNRTEREIWDLLAMVMDPEIPVISIVDLGIVRDVRWTHGGNQSELVVTVTPTYSGCPATEVIQRSIREALDQSGWASVRIETRLAPAWTTDWLTPVGREKLRRYGIAPPDECASEHVIDLSRIRKSATVTPRPNCPRCGSGDTERISQFGSTPCKALHRCLACREPFDAFKCH